MEIIESLSKELLTQFFLEDPKLCYIGLHDDNLAELYINKTYTLDPISYYIGVLDDDKIVAVCKYEYFTENAINAHFYVSSGLHHSGKTTKVKDILYNYVQKNTAATKVLIMIPETCDQVIAPAKHYGAVLEGRLTKAIKWRKELVDLLIYAYNIERD